MCRWCEERLGYAADSTSGEHGLDTGEAAEGASCSLDPTSDTNVEISLQEEEVEADSSVDAAFSQGQQENMVFSSSEEALTSLENQDFLKVGSDEKSQPSTPSKPYKPRSSSVLKLAGDRQEEVVKAARSLFSKRTRTLYHWLSPCTSKTKLKTFVAAAWDNLPEQEKHFYISQVLGRFGLQASSLMINPQLDGLAGFKEETRSSSKPVLPEETEDQKAVRVLLDSYNDPQISWTPERARKRKYQGEKPSLQSLANEIEEEAAVLKKMREAELEFPDDVELNKVRWSLLVYRSEIP
uniref:Uncharacterized protein n=1 Tax=Timema poppense TaxID=170557 RepID=A0A7R9D7V6_TIMPO|nr:unnamed protein product [Timema poppensis]